MQLVSVIVPAYNAAPYLAEALDSALAQAHRPMEIIVVNDGSTDGTSEVARAYAERGVQCVDIEHVGLGAALNRGIAESRGEFVAFLDADDIWVENKLKLQLAALREQPDLDAVFGRTECFGTPTSDENAPCQEVPEGPANWYCKSAMLIRREALERIGPFATAWTVGDFIDWYLRAQESGLKSHMLSEVVLRRRIHETNMGVVARDQRNDYVKILKAALDRRRKQA